MTFLLIATMILNKPNISNLSVFTHLFTIFFTYTYFLVSCC